MVKKVVATESYCLKDRKQTKDVSPHIIKTKNGRFMRESKCAICGGKKSTFIKAQAGGNPLEAVGAIAGAAPGIITGIADAVDQGRKTSHAISKETGGLEVEQAYNTGEKEKKFQQFYRDLMHKRFWDGDSLPPRLRFPRYKTNNPKYTAEQEAADDKLYAYAEKVFGRA